MGVQQDPTLVRVFSAPELRAEPTMTPLSRLPFGAQFITRHPSADIQVAAMPGGEEGLYINGERIWLDPVLHHDPMTVLRTLRACTSANELLDHMNLFLSLNRNVPMMVRRNDEFSSDEYFGDWLGSEIPEGDYLKPVNWPYTSWDGPHRPPQSDSAKAGRQPVPPVADQAEG